MKKLFLLVLLSFSMAATTQVVNMSNGTTVTCNATFYDSGGSVGNYGNNESFVHTFVPASPGNTIEISFAFFNTDPLDVITIYAGMNTNDPVIYSGSGSAVIPTVASYAWDGALTVEFVSNGSTTGLGWEATITCCTNPQFWFEDADGDGFGNFWSNIFSCTQPVGYVLDSDDCDDNAIMYEDLDGDGFGGSSTQVGCGAYAIDDCDDNSITYQDLDGDGYGNPNVYVPCGVTDASDCNDNDALIGSGFMSFYFLDNDGDGFGDFANYTIACNQPLGYVSNSNDCDDYAIMYEDLDGDGFGNPLLQVGCGAYNNLDCDDNLLTYEDYDGDGFGNPNVFAPCGLTNGTDCDDNDVNIGAGILITYYQDNDGDGFGNPFVPYYSCTQPVGYVLDNTDCDDLTYMYLDEDGDGFGQAGVYVGCGVFNDWDCDDNLITYEDIDGDGYGNPNIFAPCGPTDGTDCDDNNAGIGSGIMIANYVDADGDGYGFDYGFVFFSCIIEPGFAGNSDDCDDSNPYINPGAIELPGNGIDENCDGYIDGTIGIEISKETLFNIFPNPTTGLVFIQVVNQLDDEMKLNIYDINGQVVHSELITKNTLNSIELDLSSLSKGIYVVHLSSNNINTNYKLVVN